MHHLCTLFDLNYLPRGIALYNSLEKHTNDYTLWVLCLDPETERILNKLNFRKLNCIPLSILEESQNKLLLSKENRSKYEYYFTCKSYLLSFLLKKYNIDYITYVDADIYFYASFDIYRSNVNESSIALSPHRFPDKLKKLSIYGNYNAGLISFKNNQEGLNCLRWWQGKCTDWCFDKLEQDRFADQKYLDEIPVLFNSVKIVDHIGINAAPWNIDSRVVSENIGKIYIESEELVCYHFHGVTYYFSALLDTGYSSYGFLRNNIKNNLYKPYMNVITSINDELSNNDIKCVIGDRKSLRLRDRSRRITLSYYLNLLRGYAKYIKSFVNNGIIYQKKQ